MKVHLLFPDRNFKKRKKLDPQDEITIQDLQLEPIFQIMAGSDKKMYEIIRDVMLLPLTDKEKIKYRQDILKDIIKNPEITKILFNLSLDALEKERKSRFGFFTKHLGGILYSAIELMKLLLVSLRELLEFSHRYKDRFSSYGFKQFFSTIEEELSYDYFRKIEEHLKRLKFEKGMLIMAELGKGNKGKNYTLCKVEEKRKGLFERFLNKREESYSFTIDERDESGEKAISEIKDKGINNVTNALAQSAEHILNFFNILKRELSFYIGALNLYNYLREKEEPIVFPLISSELSLEGLYDPSLVILTNRKIVKNSLHAKGKRLFIITGANQGGKSTFLRSIGISQIMMQSGLFVPAESYSSKIYNGIFTHFRKEEDKEMESGKLDEELRRLNTIIDQIVPGSLILFNESFSSTNEKEGSEIAKQVISALIENEITIFFVTHMYKLASLFYEKELERVMFLRAERKEDGTRTFKITEGIPLKTAYGRDLYLKLFENANFFTSKHI